MASDVDDLSTFYASLPSIFEKDSLTTRREPIFSIPSLAVESEKTYQPMFGSFLFADSEPLTRAAFVASASSSIEMKPGEEQLIEDESPPTKTTLTSSSDNPNSPPSPPLAPTEDISDMEDDELEEDDFDGIPIRHATSMIKTKLNGGTDLIVPPTDHEHFLDRLAREIELDNEADGDDDDEDAFLNGFTDDQQHESIAGPSLFTNIPDIDDPNEHEDEEDDRISLDRMDMLDQSDSIRSSSPDSLLSSSHLRDEHDDLDGDDDHVLEMNRIEDDGDADDDDDVTQWNDEFLLAKPHAPHDRPHAPSPPLLPLNLLHPHDQVDFIDSSRSASRCSNASSHLSNGYNDQGRIFLNDDELVSSSDSEDDEGNPDVQEARINGDDEIFDRDHDEDLSLQINLDQPRSRSLSRSSISTRSSSPILDQSPIIAMDEEIQESKPLPSAPIAQVDDEDEEDLDDGADEEENTALQLNQPILAQLPWKNLLESRNERRRDELVHDIIDFRRIYAEHENDDEFIAVMHNPLVFEEVLHDIDDRQVKDNLLNDQTEY